MATIDVRGLSCPAPLVKTKKALSQARPGDTLQIAGDGDIPRENLKNYLRELGISFQEMQVGNQEWILAFIVPGTEALGKAQEVPVRDFCPNPALQESEPGNNGAYTVVVRSACMGQGDEELGRLLMKSYLNVLPDLDRKPAKICLYNEGVKLSAQGSPVLESLQKLEESGVEILVCGTCVEYFNLKDKIAVGKISNMYNIATALAESAKTVVP